MGARSRRSEQAFSDREKCEKVFNSLIKWLLSQQEQMQTLLKDRKILEDRVRIENERRVFDVRFYEDLLSQLKENLVEKEMERWLEAKKSDLMVGLKHREVSFYKMKFEQIEDELADFREWYAYLSRNVEGKSEEKDSNRNLKSTRSKTLETDVKRLKFECEKIASEKNLEISVLLKEKGFVWHQYNLLENNLTSKLKSKQAEIDQANEKIAKVIGRMELLQSSNIEKDETILRLEARVAELEADKNKLREENLKHSRDFELLKKSKISEVTPELRHCNIRAKTSSQEVKCSGRHRSNTAVKKESTPVHALVPLKDTEKANRGSKRKGVDVIDISETPKLFSAAFKVPKLKISSTPVR